MDILILSIFALVVVLSFLEDYMPSWQKVLILAVLGITLICTATLKPMTTTDARTYEYYFYYNDDEIVESFTVYGHTQAEIERLKKQLESLQ